VKRIIKIRGELEIDTVRGVVYFHVTNKRDVEKYSTVTLVRICRLNTPVSLPIDVVNARNYAEVGEPNG